ncbi:TPA: hypothetical protein G9F11_005152, partial [Salmonella enterica]|nr:hypothetical protein [Salmonella enterica]
MPLIPDVRPEAQKINPNRTDLNIAQPGEQPAFDYDSYLDSLTPENVRDYSTGANLKDYGIAVASGAANLPEGAGALANFGGQWLEKKAGELSPDHFVAKSALSDIGSFLHKSGRAVQEGVGDWKQQLESGYSQPAKNALEQGAAGSISGLTLNLANVFGDLGATVLTGGLEGLAAKGATAALLKREAVSGLVRKGLTEEAATKVADDAMEIASRKATAAQAGKTTGKYGFIASGTADAQGNTAAAAAQGILNASPQQLAGSPTFVNLYQSVQSDPQYAHLSDEDKVQVAKEQLADRVGMSLATDPKLLAVNIASTMMGDKAVADMALNGVSKSIAGGFAKGALRDGVTGGLQSGYSQYAQNVARDEDAGIATDHMQGVAKATGEGTLLGGIIGGGAGTVSGIRGRRNGVSTEQAEKSSGETPETPAEPETTTPADPIEAYRQQFSGLSRDELLQHYANADFAPEGDADAVYRKHAANGLLRDMDRADQVKGIVDEMRSKPRGEVLEEYRTLSEKEKRNDADEMRLDAAREVLRPQQPEAETRPQQTAEPQKQEPSGRRSQYDPDNLDIPAFMRDPRFRDFTDEPTEVQQHLTRGNASTPEELLYEQMAKGDAGPTDNELAERPRLPSPGDIHPGQGYPLPGEVRHMSDESPAGRGGRYTTTGEVQGQSYQKGRQTVAPEGVQRQGETFQGEQSHRELPAPERQELPRPEEPGLTSHEQGGMAVKEGSEGEKNPLQKPEKAGQQQISTEKSGEKIDDFGEVIHGAAKHRRVALAKELDTDKTLEDYHTQPFSKLFPKPDYEKMAAEGTDNKTLSMLALLRSMIPAKPRVAHRLNRWAIEVAEVRNIAGKLLDGSLPADEFIDRIRQGIGSHYSEIVKTWDMLHQLPPAQIEQAAAYRVKSHAYSMFGGKEYNPPKVFHTLENEKGRRVLDSDDLNDLHKKAKAYFDQQAASSEPADSKTKLDIYQNRRTGEVFIAYGKNKTSLQGGFKTVAEARDYAKTRRAELLEKLNKLREQSREEQRNTSNRDRTGPERHEGNVTPETFSDAFGFRGVQFGNYVEGPRRQSDLNRAYDSLMDMADVLKVPAKALSLNGRLGLAFGARGKGGKNAAAAHYEPGQVAINLTKGNGAGSLAHEWFHALDNYFGQYDTTRVGEITSGDKFMTSYRRQAVPIEHPVRQEVYDAFKGVMKAIKESALPERSRRLDEVRSKPYWSTDIEMAARAFERYVQDKAKSAGVENDFLVNIRKADDHGSPDTYAYPTQAELDGGIRQAFDHLFSTLKTRETDKGVAFYSRKGVKRTPEGNFISDTSHSKEAKGSSVAKVKAVARGVMDRIKDNTLNVRVVKSQAEAQELAGESFDGYGKVHAFYRPDEHEIVLVADNIPDGRTVREKLRHEIIHHAMEQVVTPAEYKTIVDNVLKTRNSDNAAIRETWRKVDADYGNESPEVQAGEFLAHMAEKEPGKLGAAWNRVVALIKAVLRRTGLFQPSDLNDVGYVRDTIRTLGQRVREGYVPREGGDVSYSRTGKPDPFRVPEGEGERYRRDLEKAMVSKRSSDIYLDVGRTPPVLRHLGAPDLPVSISRDVIRKATNDVKHHVEMSTIEKLPELIHDPEAVYQSATQDNSLVLWLNATDKKGNPVITAIHMNSDKNKMIVNRVASVYGPMGGMSKINHMESEGLALYRKKNPEEYRLRGLQLPVADGPQGSGRNILSPDDIRKGPYYSRSGSDLSPEETLSARFVRAMQDKFQVLKAVQDNIRKSGGKLDDSNDAYLAEELFHGKAENDLNVMKERYVKPLANLLAEYDIPQSALDEYLYARHAPERNLHIAKINPKMPDGGSGMTNAEAAGIMDRVRRSGKQAQYDRLAGIVDDMLARRRELIKSAGLESEGTVDA